MPATKKPPTELKAHQDYLAVEALRKKHPNLGIKDLIAKAKVPYGGYYKGKREAEKVGPKKRQRIPRHEVFQAEMNQAPTNKKLQPGVGQVLVIVGSPDQVREMMQ